MAPKSQGTLAVLLAVMAATLVIGGVGLFWIAWRGVQLLRREAVADAAAAPITTPTGSSDTGTAASSEDEEAEDVTAPDAALVCPLPIHPAYCRLGCRNYRSRSYSMHARRIGSPLRAGLGVCGAYNVFAEDERGPDGGTVGGLIEYFDKATDSLVGARDTRSIGCGSYGTIPQCKLEISWKPSGGSRL
jgi:hypothetical protein